MKTIDFAAASAADQKRSRLFVNTYYSIPKTILKRRLNRALCPSDRIDIRFQFVEQLRRHAIKSIREVRGRRIMEADGGNTGPPDRPPRVPNVSTISPVRFLVDHRFLLRFEISRTERTIYAVHVAISVHEKKKHENR